MPVSLSLSIFKFILAAILVAPVAFADIGKCGRFYATGDLKEAVFFRETQALFGVGDVSYTRVVGPKTMKYKEVPEFNGNLLVHFTSAGHVRLFYKNRRLDTFGRPGMIMEKYSTTDEEVRLGIYIVIKDLPHDFADRFNHYFVQSRKNYAFTCATGACSSLRALGIEPDFTKRKFTPTSMLKDLLRLARAQDGDESKMSVVSVEDSLQGSYQSIVIGQAFNQFGWAVIASVTSAAIWMITPGVIHSVFR